jgi:hypothetical protein
MAENFYAKKYPFFVPFHVNRVANGRETTRTMEMSSSFYSYEPGLVRCEKIFFKRFVFFLLRSEQSGEDTRVSDNVKNQLLFLRKRFLHRTQSMKEYIHSHLDHEALQEATGLVGSQTNVLQSDEVNSSNPKSSFHERLVGFLHALQLVGPVRQQTASYIAWLFMVSAFYIYNFFSISMRFSFSVTSVDQTTTYVSAVALAFDYISDLVYLTDIFLVKTRVSYFENGLLVVDYKQMALKYLKSKRFIVSVRFGLRSLFRKHQPVPIVTQDRRMLNFAY